MHVFNHCHTISNVIRLIVANLGSPPPEEDLKRFYVKAISQFQNHLSDSDEPAMSYEDGVITQSLEGTEFLDAHFGAIGEFSPDQRNRLEAKVKGALDFLRSTDTLLYQRVCLLVTDLILLNGTIKQGATSSAIFGTIFISADEEKWTTQFMGEMLLHEATHLNIFLADMIHGMYRDPEALDQPESLALSAVRLGQLRPLDKAFHSSVVALQCAYYWHKAGEHKLADEIVTCARDSVNSMMERLDRFTPYGAMNLKGMKRFVDHPDMVEFGRVMAETNQQSYLGN